jgi:hypothetical protein
MGCHEPGNSIAGTWTAGNQYDTRLAAGPGVAVGDMRSALLMPSKDKFDMPTKLKLMIGSI